jgi:protease-4
MDRNRKLLISILALLVLSSVVAIVDINLSMSQRRTTGLALTVPKVGPGVGIVRIEGPIMFSSSGGGAEAIIERLDELERDSDIKAVVVRINSPGGTVAATQEVYEKLWRLRRKKIITVASMGEIATSGGYYVASVCETIYANPGTITGSIGVIALSPNLTGLLRKLGINVDVAKSGRHKDMFSSFRDPSGDERAILQKIIDLSYKRFVKDVARAREMNQSDIFPYADGRIFAGETAKEYKLVDELGTFEDAIIKARELAELKKNAPVYDRRESMMERFFSRFMGDESPINKMKNWDRYFDLYRVEYR